MLIRRTCRAGIAPGRGVRKSRASRRSPCIVKYEYSAEDGTENRVITGLSRLDFHTDNHRINARIKRKRCLLKIGISRVDASGIVIQFQIHQEVAFALLGIAAVNIDSPPVGVSQTSASRYINAPLAPYKGWLFWVSPRPFDLEFSFLQQRTKKEEKNKRKALCLASLPSMGYALHGLACLPRSCRCCASSGLCHAGPYQAAALPIWCACWCWPCRSCRRKGAATARRPAHGAHILQRERLASVPVALCLVSAGVLSAE